MYVVPMCNDAPERNENDIQARMYTLMLVFCSEKLEPRLSFNFVWMKM